MNDKLAFRRIALAQLAGLALAGWWFRLALNTDAVAYLRLAEHYAQGQFHLAVSGYWGPLLSWLMAPLFQLGFPPLVAARVAMGFSAIIFFWGCIAWFRATRLADEWIRLGAWTAAAVSIPWSVGNITPDLLLAGVLAWGASFLVHANSSRPLSFSLLAGLTAGMAFLTKAVALPLSALVALGWFGWLWRTRQLSRAVALRAFGLFTVGLSVLVIQWASLLTHRYGRLTVTTSAPIAHAIAGPPDVERYHPTMRAFHWPPPGRITTWEDPSELTYRQWSPFASPHYAWHQMKVLLTNLGLSQLMLTTVFLDWPCVLGLAVWLQMKRKSAKGKRGEAAVPANETTVTNNVNAELQTVGAQGAGLPFAAIFLAALTLVYLPNYLRFGDQRFFYPALPFLFTAGVWLVDHLETLLKRHGWHDGTSRTDWRRWLTWALGASFALPAAIVMFVVLPPKRQAGELAAQLAAAMNAARLPPGPLAGSALQPGGRTGLFTAYWLRQPWLGDEARPTVATLRRSGAHYFLANRQDPPAAELMQTTDFVDVTPDQLRSSAIQLFQRRRP